MKSLYQNWLLEHAHWLLVGWYVKRVSFQDVFLGEKIWRMQNCSCERLHDAKQYLVECVFLGFPEGICTCRCTAKSMEPCNQLLVEEGRELGITWGWVNTNQPTARWFWSFWGMWTSGTWLFTNEWPAPLWSQPKMDTSRGVSHGQLPGGPTVDWFTADIQPHQCVVHSGATLGWQNQAMKKLITKCGSTSRVNLQGWPFHD